LKKNYFAIARNKSLGATVGLRILFLKLFGLKIGPNTLLGKIKCEWPNRLEIGGKCVIEDNVVFKITKPFQPDNYIKIGNRVFIGECCQFNCNTQIIVGDDCLIASNTIFVDTGHETALGMNINLQPLTNEAIILEEDVWIGTSCKILKGVRVGKGSIVGAGSVVNKSIPANQIWAGVPAKFIRNRI
jgi:acetyltransferase-like isoleucine patch superfamily enzyme